MEHIQDPIDEPPTPFKGRNPQRGRAKERKNEEIQERGSWTCDPAFDEVMQPRIMEDNRAKRLLADHQKESKPSIDDGSHHQITLAGDPVAIAPPHHLS